MSFTCNVTNFLLGPPVKIDGIVTDVDNQGSYVDVDVELTLTNPFLSTSYHGFDVIGVMMGTGSDYLPMPGDITIPGDGDQRLLNRDGYTRWFNYPEFSGAGSVWELFGYSVHSSQNGIFTPSAILNPYKYFADGIEPDEDEFQFLIENFANRGSIGPDVSATRLFEIRFPSDKFLQFKLAIIAHWKANANAPDLPGNLSDFPIEANADEALAISVVNDSTVYYLESGSFGGNVRIEISPWDWSANVISTTVDEYQVRCHSDAWDGVYTAPATPIYSFSGYHTFKTTIPVEDIYSPDLIPVWIEILYPDLDYSNDFGVENDAWGNLGSYFYYEVPVLDHIPVYIDIIQPNGGEFLEVGKDYEIKWETENLQGKVFIMYSLDDFVDDAHPIAVNEINDGSFLWQDIPEVISDNVKIRVSSMQDSGFYDISSNYFTIYDSTEPYLEIVRPNGGEIWKAGTAREIRWDWKNVQANVYIEYSKDGFIDDINIIAIDETNDGNYVWEDIPYDLTDSAKIRVTSMHDETLFDISDGYFTIDDPPIEVYTPDGGEEWKAGTSQLITWETEEPLGTLFIEYSDDYFTSDIHTIATDVEDTGTYTWDPVPNDPSTTVRVRVSATSHPGWRDFSDHVFSIEESGWGFNFGGPSNENAYDIDLDSDGNIYLTGVFKGTVDFDPDPIATDYHTSNGGMDVFLCKFNEFGLYEWALTWGGTGYDRGYGVAVDDLGNIYVTGVFKGTGIDFDPDPAPSRKDVHTSNGSYDVYISRFDSSGTFDWARTFGGTGDDSGHDVACDDSGNVYLTGSYAGLVDLDPTNGTDNHTADGYQDVFLISLASDGSYNWGVGWGGTTFEVAYDHGFGVTVDPSGYVYVTGNIAGQNIDLDPDPDEYAYVSALDGCDAFVCKYDSTGDFIYGNIWGGYLDDYGFGIETDYAGNVYIAGRFEGMVDFDPGSGAEVYISVGDGYDAYVTKFDPGGIHQWARAWGADDLHDYAWSVHAGGLDRVYVIGDFEGTVDFDPLDGVDERTSHGGYDMFLNSFNSDGTYNWSRIWGGETAMDYGYGVFTDEQGNAFITGSLNGIGLDFDPGEGEDQVHLRDTYNEDIVLIKVMPDGEW